MKALITGSEGFVGKWLREALQLDNYEVTGYDLRLGQDIRDYEKLRITLESFQPDLIFHLAAQAYVPESTSDTRRAVDVNIKGTLNLIEAMRHTGCRARVLVAGTTEEYGYHQVGLIDESSPTEPNTPYGVSKLCAGRLALLYGRLYDIPVVTTRAANHTGPFHSPIYAISSFAKKIVDVENNKAQVVQHGNLEAMRSYLDVRDVVNAYLEVIFAPSGVYNIVGGQAKTMGEILDDLCKLAHVPIQKEPVAGLYRAGGETYPDISAKKIETATGWRPMIPWAETLSSLLGYWRANA